MKVIREQIYKVLALCKGLGRGVGDVRPLEELDLLKHIVSSLKNNLTPTPAHAIC
jgi:hypothetical protein